MSLDNIKWDAVCLECQSMHDGVCYNPQCAEMHYDKWGDPIPSWVYYADGNCLKEYLAKKEQMIKEQTNNETH